MRSSDEASKILLKIEALTKTLNKGTKVWSDHLTKYLDEYMACVEDVSTDDTLGVMAISFVQAGLVIESSSKVYGSNVDYLWQFMTEVMAVLRMNKCLKSNAKGSDASAETADGSEHHQYGPQNRRTRAVFKDFEEIVVNVIDPDLKVPERNELIKPLPIQHIVTKPDWKWQKSSFEIVDVDGDTVVLSDYSVMLQASGDGKLQLNMLKEVISECSEVVPTAQENLGEMINFLELLIQELSHHLNDDTALRSPLSQGATSEYTCADPPEHIMPLSLPVTPPTSPEVDIPERIKRSLSEVDSEKEVCAAAYSARRSGEREHLIRECDLRNHVALEDSIHEKPLPCDLKVLKLEGKKTKSGHKVKMKLMVTYHGTEVLHTYLKEALFPLYADCEQLYLRHLTKKLLLLDHPKVLGTFRDQGDFLRRLSEEYDEDFFGFEDYEPVLVEEDIEEDFLGWPDEEETVGSQNHGAIHDGSVAVPLLLGASYGNANSVPCQMQNTPGIVHEDTEANIGRQVAEWELYIRPKLKAAHDRGHFDIHNVGTEILQSFPQSSAKFTLQFEQFAADKLTADIPRYFLASLQLANTYNIEITQSSPGNLGMDCMHMTLLSPVRHHEVLEDYEAPSQGAKHKHVGQVSASSDNNGYMSWSRRSMYKKKCKHVPQDSAVICNGGDSSLVRSKSKKKRKHVSQVAASNSDTDGDSSSSRSAYKQKRNKK